VEANTEAIVRLAWSRVLRVDDDGEAAVIGRRVYREDDALRGVMYVRLFGSSVFVGPSWACAKARRYSDDDLETIRTLLDICSGHGGRAVGQATLAYTDGYVPLPSFDQVVSREPEAVAALERICPPDDVSEVGLAEMAETFVLVEEDQPRIALAGAGYVEWESILGHLGVLTTLERRGAGLAKAIGAVATNDALDAGLVPQWRARVDNEPSRRVAAALGYQEVGSQTTVLLPTA
jgi:GNAT acetyltransferase